MLGGTSSCFNERTERMDVTAMIYHGMIVVLMEMDIIAIDYE